MNRTHFYSTKFDRIQSVEKQQNGSNFRGLQERLQLYRLVEAGENLEEQRT